MPVTTRGAEARANDQKTPPATPTIAKSRPQKPKHTKTTNWTKKTKNPSEQGEPPQTPSTPPQPQPDIDEEQQAVDPAKQEEDTAQLEDDDVPAEPEPQQVSDLTTSSTVHPPDATGNATATANNDAQTRAVREELTLLIILVLLLLCCFGLAMHVRASALFGGHGGDPSGGPKEEDGEDGGIKVPFWEGDTRRIEWKGV